MPNWCFTSYTFVGEKNDIHNFYDIIRKGISENLKDNGFGKNWLGNLVLSVGKDYNKIACRGTIENISVINDNYYDNNNNKRPEFELSTSTAWGAMPQIFVEIIKDNKFDIKMRMEAVESGIGEYYIYDEIEKTPRYYVDYCLYEPGTMSKELGELCDVIITEEDLEENLDIIIDTSECKNLEEKIDKALEELNSDKSSFMVEKMQYIDDITTLF